MKIPLPSQIQIDPCVLDDINSLIVADIHSLTISTILPLTIVDTLAHHFSHTSSSLLTLIATGVETHSQQTHNI